MASPQIEDGYTRIANEILEELIRRNLSPNQWRVLLYIIRKTYGFQKKADYIANFQIVEATRLCKAVVSRCLKNLGDMQLITRKGKYIGFQKDWEKWPKLAESSELGSKLAEQSTIEKLAESSTELAESSTKVSSCAVTQKKKETISKDNNIVVFRLWNEQGIVQHRKLTTDTEGAIGRSLREFSLEEVCQAIRNYAEIVHSEEYYFKYRWTLKDFLKRGLEKFLDLGVAKSNYRRDRGGKSGAHRQGSRELKPRDTYKSPEEHRQDYHNQVGA